MKVSIITLCRDTLQHMKKCFDYAQTYTEGIGIDVEWIIVNNDSKDTDMINYFDYMKKYPGITIINNTENLTFAKAHNQAANVAVGEYLVFLNSDIMVTKGWLKELLSCLGRNKAVAAGARLYFPHTETIQHAGIVQRNDGVFTHRFYKEEASKHPEIMKEEEMPVTAALMIVSKPVFERAGRFDEQFVWGYEDVDLNLKIMSNGGKIVYCPTCLAYHHEHGTDSDINKDLEANIRRLFRKWNIQQG